MAELYPHVQFRGMDIGELTLLLLSEYVTDPDLVPIATRYPPENVRFELRDVNASLPWGENTFDLVHARSVSMAVSVPR